MKNLMCVLMIGLTALAAWADDTNIQLGEVVVTATRSAEESANIPANVTVITQEEIRRSPGRTVQDLLKSEDGILFRDLYGTGTASTIDMRGFSRGLNTVVLIDGRRVNEIDLAGVDWNLIPLENIERIEVVRGGATVLYGDNATAGAINIILKKGTAQKPTLEGELRAENYNGYMGNLSFHGNNGFIGYYLFAKYRENDGYRENSEFNATDLSARLTVKPIDIMSLDISAGYHDDQQGRPGGLTKDQIREDRRQAANPDDNVKNIQRYVDAKAAFTIGSWGEIEAAYGYNNRVFDSELFFFGSLFATTRDTGTSGLRLKFTADNKFGALRNLLVAGIDYYDSDVTNGSRSDWGSTDVDLSKAETGFYFNDELFITDRLSVTLGYRLGRAKYEYTQADDFMTVSGEKTYQRDAYRAAVNYRYGKASKVFAGYAKGFRFPATDELIGFDGTVKPLKPETTDTYEAGVVHSFGERVQARLTVYTMNVQNELFVNPASPDFSNPNENADKTRHSGVEAGITVKPFDQLSVFGTFTYSDAKFTSGEYDGKRIPSVPRYSAALGADLTFLKAFTWSVQANWVDRKYLENDLTNAHEQVESHITVDTKLSYACKGLTAYAGVSNVLGEEYSDFGVLSFSGTRQVYYPAPERQFFGGIRFAF